MKDIRVEVRLKNNLIYTRIKEKGYRSIRMFVKDVGCCVTYLYNFINFKESPTSKNCYRGSEVVEGTENLFYWKPTVVKLSKVLGCSLEDLFPEHLREVRNNVYHLEIESAKLLEDTREVKLLEENFEEGERNEIIGKIISSLDLRQQRIIKSYFGFDGDSKSLREIAKDEKLSVERVNQIRNKAIRLIRHPKYSRELRQYL